MELRTDVWSYQNVTLGPGCGSRFVQGSEDVAQLLSMNI